MKNLTLSGERGSRDAGTTLRRAAWESVLKCAPRPRSGRGALYERFHAARRGGV